MRGRTGKKDRERGEKIGRIIEAVYDFILRDGRRVHDTVAAEDEEGDVVVVVRVRMMLLWERKARVCVLRSEKCRLLHLRLEPRRPYRIYTSLRSNVTPDRTVYSITFVSLLFPSCIIFPLSPPVPET
jgi:hypothetical protein